MLTVAVPKPSKSAPTHVISSKRNTSEVPEHVTVPVPIGFYEHALFKRLEVADVLAVGNCRYVWYGHLFVEQRTPVHGPHPPVSLDAPHAVGHVTVAPGHVHAEQAAQ